MKKNESDKKKLIFIGLINILIGGCLILSSLYIRGTNIKDFIAGIIIGVGCSSMLIGVYVISRTFRN